MGTRRCWITIGVIVLVGLIGLIFAGYWFNWDWTGFNQHIGPRVPQYQPTKTLWDWLQLLIIPLVLAAGALLFNLATTRTEQKIALDKQREDLFQKYLDCMSDLMLKEKLRSSAVDSEVRNFARVRTITLLFQLDARRIGYVFAFLRESGLISSTSESIVSLRDANLRKINFSQATIEEIDLRGANLSEADLSGANLDKANLSNAILQKANLSGTHLQHANLSGVNLSDADLSGALLWGANLSKARLWEVNLSKAELWEVNFSEATLVKADLSKSALLDADLTRANLREVDFSGANLTGASITKEQWETAKSLQGATMPDRSIHPESLL